MERENWDKARCLHHAGRPARGRGDILNPLAQQLEKARELYADTWPGFTDIEITIVARDEQNPLFQTVLATGVK